MYTKRQHRKILKNLDNLFQQTIDNQSEVETILFNDLGQSEHVLTHAPYIDYLYDVIHQNLLQLRAELEFI